MQGRGGDSEGPTHAAMARDGVPAERSRAVTPDCTLRGSGGTVVHRYAGGGEAACADGTSKFDVRMTRSGSALSRAQCARGLPQPFPVCGL